MSDLPIDALGTVIEPAARERGLQGSSGEGTGSVVIEQLARNCVGSLVLIDPETLEENNLNRVLNSTAADAAASILKVDIAPRAVRSLGMGTHAETISRSLFDPDTVRALARCDLVIGCMDSHDGRYLLNRLATFYLSPYLDLGVKLEADGIVGSTCKQLRRRRSARVPEHRRHAGSKNFLQAQQPSSAAAAPTPADPIGRPIRGVTRRLEPWLGADVTRQPPSFEPSIQEFA